MGLTVIGKQELAERFGGIATNAHDYIAYGDDDTAFSKTQTSLGNELDREQGTVSLTTTTDTNDTLQVSKSFNITSSITIKEVGLFNASSGGDMSIREVLTNPRSLENGATWTCTIKIVFA